ncbi:hypothetical protein BU15DRAFT_55099, partial [Melanogaster broomeanus]
APKGGSKKKAPNDGGSTTHTPTLAEQLSFLHSPRPFKSPGYTKNANRRTKNLKTVLGQEREREGAERERRRQEREERAQAMDVDGAPQTQTQTQTQLEAEEDVPSYTSLEAFPSLLPPRHYCDITGLEAGRSPGHSCLAPYTDPRTNLRYHDKSVYDIIKSLSPGVAKDYLAARGVNPIVR